jgi:hypothetical protein
MAMKQTANQAPVLLCAPVMDSSLKEIAARADRVFYFEPVVVMPARKMGRTKQKGVP